jgi:type I restriction enzyme S subunit
MTKIETTKDTKRNLPDGWRWVRLGEVCEIIAGQSPPGSTYRTNPEGLPFFQGKADFGLLNPVPRVWCVEPNKIALPGDILVSVRAPVGPTNIADVKCCIGRGLAAIRCGGEADIEFILSALRHFESRLVGKGAGSTFEAISRDDLEQLSFPLPPLLEQRRIAGVLHEQMAALAKARAAAQARLEAVKTLPAAFLRQVFPQPGQPLPAGWRWVKLGEACEINPRRNDITRPDIEATSFVPMEAVDAEKGIICEVRARPFAEVKKGYTYFEEGDVLFAKITPCMQNGKHAIAHNLIEGIGFASTEFHVIRPAKGILAEWIHHFVRQPAVLQDATNHFTGAVGQQRVPDDFLESLEIPLPPLDEQRRIAGVLREQMAAVEKARAAAEEESATINALPAALLRRAFNGEI